MKQSSFFLFIFLLFFQYNFCQGKLDKAGKSLKKSIEQINWGDNSPHSSGSSNGYSNNDNPILLGLGRLIVELGLYLTYYTLVETPVEKERTASTAFITKYPYFNSKKGNYSYKWGTDTGLISANFRNNFITENSKLYGNHFTAELRFFKRISLETDYLQLWEHNTFFGDNSLAIFTTFAKYHRIRTERFNAYWGIGASYIAGEVEELGFTYGLGAEYFFARPMSIEANFNQSSFKYDTTTKFNALLNYHIDRFKISGGYESFSIGAVNFSTFSVGVGIFL
ncbi:hypothetical protein AB832_03615 [Flavobacteriaceae bacterium (ex Bugula neritina AB1)]|nr:hypothetical protein AB832_03615 [Flavobacteriaceae bacterium (ex Bugula neritina AB1)]